MNSADLRGVDGLYTTEQNRYLIHEQLLGLNRYLILTDSFEKVLLFSLIVLQAFLKRCLVNLLDRDRLIIGIKSIEKSA